MDKIGIDWITLHLERSRFHGMISLVSSGLYWDCFLDLATLSKSTDWTELDFMVKSGLVIICSSLKRTMLTKTFKPDLDQPRLTQFHLDYNGYCIVRPVLDQDMFGCNLKWSRMDYVY